MTKSISHIQITQGLMKGFKLDDDEKKVYYLDLKTNTINDELIKCLGGAPEYFLKETETKLSKRIEHPFGEAIKKIKNNYNSHKDRLPRFNKKETTSILRYIFFSVYRSKLILDSANNTLKKANFKYIFNADSFINLHLDNYSKEFNKYSKSRNIGVLVNKTNIGFVLPSNCIYWNYALLIDGYSNEILPITPKYALITLTNKELDMFPNKEDCPFIYIDTEDDVNSMNKGALDAERGTNNDFLVAKTKDVLESLLTQ